MTGWNIEIGDELTREEISQNYGGSKFGGIEPSAKTPNIFIYTDPDQGELHGYDFDGWDEDETVFRYTGEGRVGNQEMNKGNAAILNHIDSNRSLRIFAANGIKEGTSKTKVQMYLGEFEIDSENPYSIEKSLDDNGDLRNVFAFRLLPLDNVKALEPASWVYVQNSSGKWRITEKGIYEAIDEFRKIGRKTFLSVYGFKESTTYKLLFDGELFDPKAIVGVAHKWSEHDSSPLTSEELSGGKDRGNANWCLSQLGFQIVEIKTVTKSVGKSKEIQVEKRKAGKYLISGRKESVGERKESRLQEEYRKYLESSGHQIISLMLPSEERTSYVDLFDKTSNELYEAKSSADHVYVWKAIGQVLYYAHLSNRDRTVETVSILLPSLPEKELLELMHGLGIVCVYKTNDSFERIEPG